MTDKITLLSLMDYTEAQLDKLRNVSPQIEVHQLAGASFDDIPEVLRNRAEILYGWGNHFKFAHHFSRLKWIQAHSAGIEALVESPTWHSQVIVTTLSGVHPVAMAEHALAMMLAFRWKLLDMVRLRSRSEWPKGRWQIFCGPELRGSTLGIIGYGAVGRELARQTEALGMRILAVNRSGQRRPYNGFAEPATGDPAACIPDEIYTAGHLLQMLPRCDYVVVVAPLIPETHHLCNTAAFASMKKSAYFINLARGGLVDEPALIEALQQGQLAGAALDVFEEEPLPAHSPLWQLENVIISPHVSGFSPTYDDRASDLFAENLHRYLTGEPLLNLLDRERGY